MFGGGGGGGGGEGGMAVQEFKSNVEIAEGCAKGFAWHTVSYASCRKYEAVSRQNFCKFLAFIGCNQIDNFFNFFYTRYDFSPPNEVARPSEGW